MKIKPGVRFHPSSLANPATLRILNIAQKEASNGYEITITSGVDGKHSDGSAHYTGKAFDLRTKDFPASTKLWAERIQKALGSYYFVLVESDHLHIQYNG